MKHTRTLILAAVLVLSVATMLFAGAQDFDIHNRTGQTITHLYISSTSTSQWGRDILGAGVLPNGESRHITFSGFGDQCTFDIKARTADGEDHFVMGQNLCEITDLNME
jgi:hypothetical protein